jgi:hypothetical protein
MLEFFSLPQNFPFSVALTLMIFIALMEGILTLLGLGLSQFLDSLLPDLTPDLGLESADMDSIGSLSKILGWLCLGRLPALMWLVIFLTIFGLLGFSIQATVHDLTGQLLTSSVASLPSLFLSLIVVHYFGGWLSRFIPKEDSTAVSEQSFIGSLATITIGTARQNYPAEAKVTDSFGKTHYLMIEPDEATEEQFNQGDQVLIVRRQKSLYLAVKNEDTAFLEK